MMVILTKPEGRKMDRNGPLRQMHDDLNNLNRRLNRVEEEVRDISRDTANKWPNWNSINLSNLTATEVNAIMTRQQTPPLFNGLMSLDKEPKEL
jgi:hypothetical protein